MAPSSPSRRDEAAAEVDASAGEGEEEIQRALFVGNWAKAVEACLDVRS